MGRRRAVRVLGALAPVVLLVVLWQPVKPLLVDGLVVASAAGAKWLGLDEAATAEPVVEPQGAAPVGPPGRAAVLEPDGHLVLPADFREWVFVGAGVGLSYSEDGQTMGTTSAGPGAFTHVYLEPSAYRAYRDTRAFPEGTTFVLDIHGSASGRSIARGGWFQGDRLGTHAAVKDSSRFAGGWGYFVVDRTGRGRAVGTDTCRSCHVEHGAVDNVFVQFYPLLRDGAPAASGAGAGSGMR